MTNLPQELYKAGLLSSPDLTDAEIVSELLTSQLSRECLIQARMTDYVQLQAKHIETQERVLSLIDQAEMAKADFITFRNRVRDAFAANERNKAIVQTLNLR